jgi:glyceraldehyde-3-phosphate dehydrogenase (NAD(P))
MFYAKHQFLCTHKVYIKIFINNYLMSKVKVAVNGYGTIGKRVADAVSKQDDMELVGITKNTPDYDAKIAVRKGYDVYSVSKENIKNFLDFGIEVKGSLEDLLPLCDVVVDCSPEGFGIKNKEIYKKFNKKAIFQGGEEAEVADVSFVAQVNYESAIGKNYVRIVSCNTTGLCRSLYAIFKEIGIEHAIACLTRRAADPHETKKGPIDAIEIDPQSHHWKDVKTVIPNLSIMSMADKVPATHFHVHSIACKLSKEVDAETVFNILSKYPRITFVSKKDGVASTGQLLELAREYGRPRNDLYEVIIWKDSIQVKDGWLYFKQAVPQESIVIPENIDAIRAMLGIEKEAKKSIEKTDKNLGYYGKLL